MHAFAHLKSHTHTHIHERQQRPFNVTLHRAIDLTPDPVAAVEVAVRLGIDRILTSGGAGTAMEGRAVIRRMVGFGLDALGRG